VKGLPDPLPKNGIAELALQIRRREVSLTEITRAYIARIEALNPILGAYTSTSLERAADVAASLDHLLAGGTDLGPLMGIPISIKDLFTVDGLPTSVGGRVDCSDLIQGEGSFVRLLKNAGCVILGKTRTTEFAMGGVNLIHPRTTNPWDAKVPRTPGGSSSGAGCAMAAGLCGVAIGADAGGSVRMPAAFCGTFGYKASSSLWPKEGAFSLSMTFDSLGFLTASAVDALLVFEALGGERPKGTRQARGLRLCIPADHFFDNIDSDVGACFDAAVNLLKAEGVEIDTISLPEASEIGPMFAQMVPAEFLAAVGKDRFVGAKDVLDPLVWNRVSPALDLPAIDYIKLVQRQRTLEHLVHERTSQFDGWLVPTVPKVPAPFAQLQDVESAASWNLHTTQNTRPGNVFGQCGVSLPIQHLCGVALPVGLQLSMRRGSDARLLQTAMLLEQILEPGPRPDVGGFLH
jgi:aspartyl-tRNA(Asn)/glutamyl-tRNA(Gln) amidotransferase subunit A